jgi:hypothetical protein
MKSPLNIESLLDERKSKKMKLWQRNLKKPECAMYSGSWDISLLCA